MELLICIGLVGFLLALTFVGMRSVSKQGDRVKEVAAGKTLMSAYLAHAADNNQQVMVGLYLSGEYPQRGSDPGGYEDFKVVLPDGQALDDVSSSHYTFRLARYMNFQVEGGILVAENLRRIEAIKGLRSGMPYYGMSLYPSFGINDYFTRRYLPPTASDRNSGYEAERIQRVNQVERPGMFVVFATAAYQDDLLKSSGIPDGKLSGFHRITPPRFRTSLWETENQLDPRHDGKVLCAFLDGSVRSHTVEELQDMRYWSYRAQQENKSDYQVATQGSSGIGGGSGGRR